MRNIVMTAALAAFGTVGAAYAETKWDMPTPYPEATFHTQNIMQFAKDIEEATGGEIAITVHPAGSLYKHPEIKNAVRKGLAPIGEVLISRLSNEDPIFAADAIPFMASGYDASKALYDATRPMLEEKLSEQGLTFLYAVPWPPQGLYTKAEIKSADDLKGVKMRAYNAALEQLSTLVGAVPTQVEVPDIPTAFQTGRVDAMITSPSTGANSKAWDFLSNYYDTQAWLPKNMVVVNTSVLDALTDEQKQAVMDAAAAAETRGWEMSAAEATSKTQELADNGIVVADPSPELLEAMNAAGETMAAEWAASVGEAGQEILDKVAMAGSMKMDGDAMKDEAMEKTDASMEKMDEMKKEETMEKTN